MARIPGRVGRVEISSDGGTTFHLLGCIIDASMTGNQDELEVTCHESGQFREYISGRKDATMDVSMHWDEEDVGQNILMDAFFSSTGVAIRFRMEERTGAREFVSNAIVTSWSPTSPNDDVADIDATLRLSGDFSAALQT